MPHLGEIIPNPRDAQVLTRFFSWATSSRAPHAEDGVHTSEHRHRDINDRGSDATDGPSRRCCALVAVVRSRKAAPRIIIAPTSLAGTARYLVVVTCTEQAATTITLYVLRANTIILCVLWIRVLFFWRSRNCAGLKAQGACHRCAPVRAAADGAKPTVQQCRGAAVGAALQPRSTQQPLRSPRRLRAIRPLRTAALARLLPERPCNCS